MGTDVFISYRRSAEKEDKLEVDRLKSELQCGLKDKSVYLDVHEPATGESIKENISKKMGSAQVLIIVIDRQWIDSIPRLWNDEDLVRFEIESALEHDIYILPIVLSGGQLPSREDLPKSLKKILDRQATIVPMYATYEDAIEEFIRVIEKALPRSTERALTWLANNNAGNIVLGLAITGALMLFCSRMLDIHTFSFEADIYARLGNAEALNTTVQREAGVLMAWNWTAAFILITPAMALLAISTLKEAKAFLDTLEVNEMIFYMIGGGQQTPVTARRLWDAVIRPTSVWCRIFVALSVVLGTVQWWQYSGKWLIRGYDQETFLRLSTGPDWNIAWALGVEYLATSGTLIISFTLLMYLVYGIGTAITYSYYAFLFNFSSTLSHFASSTRAAASTVLKLDVRDEENGGLAAFKRIQSKHASFCNLSLIAMYLMSLRNAYLPLDCRVPERIYAAVGGQETVLEHCTSMGEFSAMIILSFKHFLMSIIDGHPDFGILFFTYSEQNHFVMGSALYVFLIVSFFVLISVRMKSIVESAQMNTKSKIATTLLRRLSFENIRVTSILFLGGLSTVFLNLGPLVLALALLLVVVDKVKHRKIDMAIS